MRYLIAAAALLISGGALADEPQKLTEAQMDRVTAGEAGLGLISALQAGGDAGHATRGHGPATEALGDNPSDMPAPGLGTITATYAQD